MDILNESFDFEDDSNDNVLMRFKNKKKRSKGRQPSSLKRSFRIENNRYIPLGPYPWKRIKKHDNTLERLLFIDPKRCLRLYKNFIKELMPKHPFRAHLEWMAKALSLLPLPACSEKECQKPAQYFTVRKSHSGQISFNHAFIFCEEHAYETKQFEPSRITILPLKPSSMTAFILNGQRAKFRSFILGCFNIKLDGQSIFKAMKACLPSIEISLPPQKIEAREKNQYQMEL